MTAPMWVKPPQTSHGTHQYARHHPSFAAHAGNSSNSAPMQPMAPVQRESPQVPTPATTRPADNPNATRNFPLRPIPEFTPLPMTYEDFLPSLIANQLAVVTPGKIFQPPFPKWYVLTHLARTTGMPRGIPSKSAWPLNTRSNI